jgi:hypothetical protein
VRASWSGSGGLPDDLEPLRKALHAIVNRDAHVILFTNAMQLELRRAYLQRSPGSPQHSLRRSNRTV